MTRDRHHWTRGRVEYRDRQGEGVRIEAKKWWCHMHTGSSIGLTGVPRTNPLTLTSYQQVLLLHG